MAFRNLTWVQALVESLGHRRSRRRRVYSSNSESLEPRQLLAAVIEPVVDLNTKPAGISAPFDANGSAQLSENLVVFAISTLQHGEEVWRTDGTAEGTFRLTDHRAGPPSSSPTNLTRVGNQVYFVIYSNFQSELWWTDGTFDGTGPVIDADGDAIDEGVSSLQAVSESHLTFIRNSDVWITDGTSVGTTRLVEIRSEGLYARDAMTLTLAGGGRATYISASTLGSGDQKLLRYDWATDTLLILSSHESLILRGQHEGRFLFTANSATHGTELWYSDGTPETTALWSDLNPGVSGSYPTDFFFDGPNFYFSAETEEDGRELWKLTNHGATPELISIAPGATSSNPSPIVKSGSKYFITYQGVYRLNDSDQPILVDDVDSLNTNISGIRRLQQGSAGLFLIDDAFSFSRDALRLIINPIDTSTVVRGGFERVQSFVGHVQGKALFVAADDGKGLELWVSDGTESGTQMVREIEYGTTSSFPEIQGTVGGQLAFTGHVNSTVSLVQAEAEGVRILSNGYPEVIPLEAGSYNGELNGILWHSIVTEPGGDPFRAITTWDGSRFRLLVRLSNQQSPDLGIFPPTKLSEQVSVVSIRDESDGTRSLWTIGADGVLGVKLAALDRIIQNLWKNENGRLYFALQDDTGNRQTLWQSDGTIAGTHAVPDFPIIEAYDPVEFGPGFLTSVTVDDFGLIFLDTTTGVVSLADDIFTSPTYFLKSLGATSEGMVFTRNGDELWVTSGTASSTRHIADIPIIVGRDSVLSDGLVWFIAESHVSSTPSLWRTDGTTAGTRQVVELPSDRSVVSGSFTKIDGRFLFTTTERRTGRSEIWLSDGTSAGTFVISDDLIVGDVTQFVQYDHGIAFAAATPAVGREVFRIDTTIAVVPPSGIMLGHQGVQWDDSRGAVQYDVWLTNLSDPRTPAVRKRVNSTLFDLPALVDTHAYRIWIRSVPIIGEPSAWSGAFDFTPGLNPVVHSMPAVTTDTTPTFRWAGGVDVASFELWVTHRDTKTRPIYLRGLTETSFTPVTPLPIGRHAVWVRATRTNGSRSEWSTLTEFDLLLPAIRLTSSSISRSSRPLLTWNAVDGATHYEVRVLRADGSWVYATTGIQGLSHAPGQDLPAGSLAVFVKAMNGTRPLTIAGSGDALIVLLPPTIQTVTNSRISWSAVPEAVTYTVELRNAAGQLHRPFMTVGQTSVSLTPTLTPGQYSVRVFTNFRQGSSNWSAPFAFEVFRPATRITSSNAPTADATPIISWEPVAGASGYEIQAARSAAGAAVYNRTGISGASHRIENALPAGLNFITVRALFADGSRTHWSAAQQLMIGPSPTITFSNRTVSWNSVNQATHFELWINFLDTPPRQKIVYEPTLSGRSYQMASTLPRGRYQVWLRAVRAENGESYPGLWASTVIELT